MIAQLQQSKALTTWTKNRENDRKAINHILQRIDGVHGAVNALAKSLSQR